MSKYVIEVRQVAESTTGLISKGSKVLTYKSKEEATKFGKENIEKSRYIASWEAITLSSAKARGHDI